LYLGNYAGQYQTNNNRAYFGNYETIDCNTARVVNISAGINANEAVNKGQLDTKLDLSGGTLAGELVVNDDLQMNGTIYQDDANVIYIEDDETTFAVTENIHELMAEDEEVTIGTITGGKVGVYTFLFPYSDNEHYGITITDTDAHTANTIDLSAAFTSTDHDTITLLYDGFKWYEVSRSVN